MFNAEMVKQKRAELHLTQKEFAHLLKLGRNGERTVRRWEAGETEPAELYMYYIQQLESDIPFLETKAGNEAFTYIDLFAGIGGMHLAYSKAGGKCLYANEWDKYCQVQYRSNFGIIPEGDITQIDASTIPDHDILLAGFPCQPFSIAGISKKNSLGRETGFLDKTQGTLFFDVVRIMKEKRPKAFMLENVKNLKSHDRGKTWITIKESLEALDYEVFAQVLDGQAFVPQHRERIIIVGFDRKRYGDTIDFCYDIKMPANKPKLSDILEKRDVERYILSDKLWSYLQDYAEKHRKKGNGFGYGMPELDGITRTLSARYYKDGSEILIKQEGKNPRKLTPRECARLQGFPDNYRIVVSDTQAYKQFGNSVVVPLIEQVAYLVRDKIIELDTIQEITKCSSKKHQNKTKPRNSSPEEVA